MSYNVSVTTLIGQIKRKSLCQLKNLIKTRKGCSTVADAATEPRAIQYA